MELFRIDEMPDVYGDAVVTDDKDQLLFLSLWGTDTALQTFLARLSLPENEGGITHITFIFDNGSRLIDIKDANRFSKHTGKAPKGSLVENLSQLWLYDNLVITPDKANR